MSNRHIKLAIIGAGYTQRRAAIDAAIPEVRISNAIHGKATLTDAELRRLAGVLGVPLSTLTLSPTVDAAYVGAIVANPQPVSEIRS